MSVPSSIEYQLFPESYFSGCDVSIYIGEDWIDDIVGMQFSIMEQVQPLYGYNSYTCDAIARGSRTIQGTFRINFREADYLRKVLQKYKEASSFSNQFLEHSQFRSSAFDAIYGSIPVTSKGISNMTLEEQEQLSKMMHEKSKSSVLVSGYKAPIGQEKSFFNKPHFHSNKDGFNIVIVYGIPGTDSPWNPNTFHSITGVQISGATQVISPDGSPIFEDYSFIAKDLN